MIPGVLQSNLFPLQKHFQVVNYFHGRASSHPQPAFERAVPGDIRGTVPGQIQPIHPDFGPVTFVCPVRVRQRALHSCNAGICATSITALHKPGCSHFSSHALFILCKLKSYTPACIPQELYVDVEFGDNQFYSKFSTRHQINEVLEFLWSVPIYRWAAISPPLFFQSSLTFLFT